MRTHDVLPDASGPVLVEVLRAHRDEFEAGAIVTLDHLGARLKILPVRRRAP